MVSVVVPVKNGGLYLDRALTTALEQSLRDLEVIVVDDGSTDDSASIAHRRAAEDARVRYVEATGAGVAAARNQGIELARSDLIAPLDADDLWFPAKLERQVHRLEECGPDFAVAYSWAYLVDADDRIIGASLPFDARTMRRLEGDVFLPLLYKCFTGGSHVLIRRSCAQAVGGYDSALDRREDYDLMIRLAERFLFALVPAFLQAYRQTPTSRSHGEVELLGAHDKILDRVLRNGHRPVPRPVRRWSRSESYAYASARCKDSGRTLAALKLFAQAVVRDPAQLLRTAAWRAGAGSLGTKVLRRTPPLGARVDPTRAPPDSLASRPQWWPHRIPTPYEWLERRRFLLLQRWAARATTPGPARH